MEMIKKAILSYILEEELPLNYGHKLRGFFANQFKDILFHNHMENGNYRYAYPLIQYKIIEGRPIVLGIERGAELIIDKFLDIDKLILGEKEFIQPESRLEVNDEKLQFVIVEDMLKFKYRFYSPWIGLNQRNYKEYIKDIKEANYQKQKSFFKKILIGNILTFAKGVNWWIEEKIKVVPKLNVVNIKFKNKDMLGFTGEFYSNVSLPNYIGLGKLTARGFGTIIKEELV